jgi:thioredoxin 1
MASPHITDVNDGNFEDEVLKADKIVLIDFYADWCGPCRAMAPALEAFAAENADKVKVVKVNIDDAPQLSRAFGIRSIPTLVTMKDGQAIFGVSGSQSKKGLEGLVEQSLQKAQAPHINEGGQKPPKGDAPGM